MLQKTIIFSIIFLSAILQVAFLLNIFYWGIGPNILLLLVIFWTTQEGFESSMLKNISVGFIADLIFFSLVGMNVASFSLVAFLVGFISKRFLVVARNWRIFILAVTIILGTALNNLFLNGIFSVTEYFGRSANSTAPVSFFSIILAKEIVLNILFFPLVYFLLKKIQRSIFWQGRLAIGIFLLATLLAMPVRAESIVPNGVTHIDSCSVALDIKNDATIFVTETIEYNFGDNASSDVTRYIPVNYQDLNGTNISIDVTDISVTDKDNNSYNFKQTQLQDKDNTKKYLAINIGAEEQTDLGIKTKTFIIRYTVSGAIKFLADHDELFWDATGDKWPVFVKYPEIKINLPQRVDRENVTKKCFIGLSAATVECIDRINNRKDPDVYYSYKGVVSGESMTTVMGFPKNIVQKKATAQQSFLDNLKTNRRMQILLAVAGILFLAIIIFIIYFKKIKAIYSWKKIKRNLQALYEKIKNTHARWWIALSIVFLIIFISGAMAFWRVKNTLDKISVNGASLNNIVQASLDKQGSLKGENDDQINVLLLGILGANHPGGGLNTDTIMVASIKPKANKISLVSIPRDLWVMDPGRENKSKINAVYIYGEEKGAGQGISDMEKLVSEITGLTMHYTVIVSTEGFVQLVDTLGGVEVNLAKSFNESAQFVDIKVCDEETFTIPTGEFKERTKNKKVVSRYPLCKNKNPECGGNFSLPAGKNILNGEKALCFIRSRYLTSDFERAKRQQLVLQQLKQKSAQFGFGDFGKINAILSNLGDNVRTDMQLSEMRRLFELYKKMDNPKMYQRVLDDSKEGLLYAPDITAETGFVLLPRGDNYEKIQELFRGIFNKAKN